MKRTLSLILAIALVFSIMATGLVSQAASFSDINHWAKTSIEYMAGKGVLNGYPDGTFKPNNSVKKDEFIKMMNYTFGLTERSYKTFPDVPSNEWYNVEIQKAAANGYLTVDSITNKVNPEDPLTRQEAAALLARYLGLEASTYGYLSFKDSAQISSIYKNYVIACVEAGIFKGDDKGNFNPTQPIERGEAVTVLNRVIGSFVDSSTTAVTSEDAVINKSGVSLSSLYIAGDLLITEGAEGGTVTLYNSVVNGNIKLKGAATLRLVNSTIAGITTQTDGAVSYISATGTSIIRNTTLNTPAVINNSTNSETYGFTTVNTASAATAAASTLTGAFETVNVTTAGTTLNLSTDTVVETLNIVSGATKTTVKGKGYAEQLNVNASGATIETAPKAYKIANKLSAVIAGVTRTGTGTGIGNYPKMYVLSDRTVEIKNMTSTYGTTYWMAVTRGSTAPTAAQIKNGSYGYYGGYVDSGAISGYSGVESSDTTKALTAGSYYDIYYYTESYGSTATTVAYKTIYVTSAPTFTYTLGNKTYTNGSYTQTVTINAANAATAYIVAVPTANLATVPTASQVYEAANGIGTYKPSGMITTTAALNYYGRTQLNLTGMTNSSYSVYVVVANETGYSPVLSARNGAATATGTGFSLGYPYVSNVNTATNTAYVSVQAANRATGTVYYMPIAKNASMPDANTIRNNAMYYSNSHSGYGYLALTTANQTGTFYANPGKNSLTGLANDVAVVFYNANGVAYTPVRVTLTATTSSFTVTSIKGVNGLTTSPSTALDPAANIVLTFSSKIYNGRTALNSNTSATTLSTLFVLKDASGKVVPATVSVDSTGTSVAINPTENLAENATYTITMDVNSASGVQIAPSVVTVKTAAAGTSTPSTPSTGDVTVKVIDASGKEVKVGANNVFDVYSGPAKVSFESEYDVAYRVEGTHDTFQSYTKGDVVEITVESGKTAEFEVQYTKTTSEGTLTTNPVRYTLKNTADGGDAVVIVTDKDGVVEGTVDGDTTSYVISAGAYGLTIAADGATIKWSKPNNSGEAEGFASLGGEIEQSIVVKYQVRNGYAADSWTAEKTIKIIAITSLTAEVEVYVANEEITVDSNGTYAVTLNAARTFTDDEDKINLSPAANGFKYKYKVDGGDATELTDNVICLSDVFGKNVSVGDDVEKTVTIWAEKGDDKSKETTVKISIKVPTAATVGTEKYGTVKAAIDAASKNGGTVVIDNGTFAETFKVDESVEITINGGTFNGGIHAANGAEITINNGVTVGDIVADGGRIVIEGGTITGKITNTATSYTSATCVVLRGGQFTTKPEVNDVTIRLDGSKTLVENEGYWIVS